MWRRSLNSVTLATTTHRRPKKVADGTNTQIATQMVDKCMIKMICEGIYNVKEPPCDKGRKKDWMSQDFTCRITIMINNE